MVSSLMRDLLAKCKGIPSERLAEWGSRELMGSSMAIVGRLWRGLLWRCRLGSVAGRLYCDANVRICYPQHLRAGRDLNLEEGCEIVAFARRGVVFGERCTVGRHACIRPTNVLLDEPGEGFRMGDHSNVGAFSYIGCSGFVDIGHNVIMGPRVNVLAENHRFESMEQLIKDQGVDRSPIVIEDNCWIGAGATIVAGTRIRSGTVVAAGAVVTKDTPADSVVGGVPARVLCGRRGEAKAHAEKGALCTRTGRSL